MKIGLLIGGLVIALCMVIAGVALSGSSRKAISFAEARATGEPCEIYGEVKKSETRYDMRNSRLTFVLQELDAHGRPTGETMPVVYTRVKPASFEEAQHVKAIGVFANGSFQAESLLVKCPSKYQGKDADPEVARRAYSTRKGGGQ